ncbi:MULTISPECIES: hypothetical protein [unclassified Streptomyces]|uniref:hypothetical protein n=1 Tax=unclassified Streptomyces TaxID=2593676 RepID=UPI002F912A43
MSIGIAAGRESNETDWNGPVAHADTTAGSLVSPFVDLDAVADGYCAEVGWSTPR